MSRPFELFIDLRHGRVTATVIRKTQFFDLYVDTPEVPAPWGSIYMGRVVKVDRALDAAIVDLGNGLSGLLPGKHAHPLARGKNTRRAPVGEILSPGQTIIVQVKSEAKRGTKHDQLKLPRLTAKIAVMGQYSHYTPLNHQTLMSRKIAREDVIDMVNKLKAQGRGFLVQATAEEATQISDIAAEADQLVSAWQTVQADIAVSGDKPRLLLRGPSALERVFLDYGSDAFEHIYVADKNLLTQMQDWCAGHAPTLATSKRLRLFKPEKLGQKLFDIYDLEGAIEDLADDCVYLGSGGSIIIEYTHAVVMIDVNQGSTGSVVEANIEAAQEVARQIRLRNLSGAILIDFINMSERSQRAAVLSTLEQALAGDTAQALIHGFTRIGIVEITRKRRTGMYVEYMPSGIDLATPAFNKNA